MTSVSAGRHLGPYEVVSRVGSGGMGDVFRARDTRLDRTVAIKILPAEFADNAELKARFEREARAISQISHPHICALYDVGNADGVEYLVLEFIEGETLSNRIARGPLPLADVLRFGSQLASALACAHRAGIVHRDLKPGNVMITKSGAKLLDFGIARSAPPSGPRPDELATQAPLTQSGTILGTFQYMSPEQLAGEQVDPRSDIFALGAVLYEMLTGVRAFGGTSRTNIIAAVLAGSPRPASSLRPATPPALEHVIAKCLVSERDDRWQSAADIASELTWIGSSPADGTAAAKNPLRRTAVLVTLAIAVTAVVAAGMAGGYSLLRRAWIAEQPVRSDLLMDESITPALFGAIALSPDGTRLLALVGPTGNPSVAIRSLATGETKKLAGTEGATYPFWAPDSQRVAFFAGGKLKTIGASGGSVQTVCDAKQGRGGSWSRNGVIVFAPDFASALYKVSENGGTPVAATRLTDPNEQHRQPTFLPDGKAFLFVVRTGDHDLLRAGTIDGSLDTRVVDDASNAAFAGGRLFFARDGTLFSQPFDPAKLALSGTLTPVADRIDYFKVRSIANFSVTDTKLAYVSEASPVAELVVHDRSGRAAAIPAGAANYRILDISPDDRTLAVSIDEHFEQGDFWFVQIDGGGKSRLTFTREGALSAAFSADGTRLATASGYFGQAISVNVRSMVSNLTEKIVETRGACVVTGWSHDGKYLVVDTQRAKTGFDVERIDLAAKTMTPVVQGPADEVAPALAPNGKWLAYVSLESGAPEIYLTTFPEGQGKWQATPNGGNSPRWSRDGKQLVYMKDGQLMAVAFHESGMPQFGTPTALNISAVSDRLFVNSYAPYAVTSDGRIINTQPVGYMLPTIHLVTNWSGIVGR